MSTPSEQDQIRNGERVQAFLAEPAVKDAFDKLEKSYLDAWKASKSGEEREQLFAKVSVLEDLKLELRVIVSTGIRAKVESERRERSTQRNHQRAR